MRLALFGGTFDPIHRGHLAIAGAAADRLRLDTVLFAPTGRQPLKDERSVARFEDRLAMVELVCATDSRFRSSRLDAPHADGTPNYTVDTLHDLVELYPDATLFNLVGADSFHNLARWRAPESLIALTEWIVVSRPSYELDDPEGYPLTDAQRLRVHVLDSVNEDVSATDLRRRLGSGDECEELLPAAVAEYIRVHHLYQDRYRDEPSINRPLGIEGSRS